MQLSLKRAVDIALTPEGSARVALAEQSIRASETQIASARAAFLPNLDGTVQEERIYHMAGAATPQVMHPTEIVRLIQNAGRTPVERDTLYNVVAEGAALIPDKPFRREVRRSLEVVS
jgi:outer membrane protein TolC